VDFVSIVFLSSLEPMLYSCCDVNLSLDDS